MPSICEFMGIKIYIYYDEHNPPHIHVIGAGIEAVLSINDGSVREGALPPRLKKVVAGWIAKERGALLENWNRTGEHKPLFKVQPPE